MNPVLTQIPYLCDNSLGGDLICQALTLNCDWMRIVLILRNFPAECVFA